ncbi:hypothetical protein CC86DRAFT_27497 [Ophiobolus disseminans]|uniref:FAR-17a/AIG1-like protein n=1 Tax=Ophiobolus disseminans TaxID=1469910 RepID=A0A6A7A0P3_9PLEO|nr:hypothetical protein CC86DRAFT_27497 [Ophiobolus disseminans]
MKIFSYESWGIDPHTGFDPNKSFVRSHLVSPLVLACIRAVLCIYSFTTITVCYTWLAHRTATISLKDVNIGSYTIQQSDEGIGQSFSFFTYLTFWSLGFYFLVSSVHTFMYAFRQRTWLHSWPKPLQLAHSLYYSTVTCFPFLVTIVFWGTMNSGWPAGRFEQWINISVHGLNSVFAIVEILLPATAAPPVTHLSIVLAILSIYLGLAYLTRYTQGIYVYEWLNPAHGTTSIILHVLGYAGGMLTIFVIVRYVIIGRNALARKMELRRSGGLQEKAIKLDDGSSTWSASVEIERPRRARNGEHGGMV